jgi:cyanophycin synthetase
VSADHLGLRGIDTVEQLAEVKAVIPSVVKPGGHTVLNADDPLVLAMRARTKGKIVLFSARPQGESSPVEAHLATGGMVVRLEGTGADEQVVIVQGRRRDVIASVREIPLTFGGAARFQLENILGAVAAAAVQGMPAERIREGLMRFTPSAANTPGRMNIIETTRGRVIIDYAHNAAAIGALVAFVAETPATSRMVMLGVPGDRRDEDIRDVARRALGMDYVIFKEHHIYRRGRFPGEIANMMRDALVAAGHPADRVIAFAEEHEAVAHAISRMAPGSVTAITSDDTDNVMEQLGPYVKADA